MLATTNLICCNFSYLPQNSSSEFRTSIQARIFSQQSLLLSKRTSKFSVLLKPQNQKALTFSFQQKGVLQICQNNLNTQNSEEETGQGKVSSVNNGEEEGRDWTTSILLFVLWSALMYYVFNLTPDQTPLFSKSNFFFSVNAFFWWALI